jgi:hypothetical protein
VVAGRVDVDMAGLTTLPEIQVAADGRVQTGTRRPPRPQAATSTSFPVAQPPEVRCPYQGVKLIRSLKRYISRELFRTLTAAHLQPNTT